MSLHLPPGVRRLFRLSPRSNSAIHAEMDDELESLLASRVEYLMARGMSPVDARAESLRRLGASLEDARLQLHQSAEHRERRMQLRERLESLWQDVRYAARGLARRPAFTAVAVLTLAVGIGATTATFSAVNVMILRPLPYPRPDELMKVSLVTPTVGERKGNDQVVWSYPKYTLLRETQRSFSELAPFVDNPFVLTSGDVERVNGEFVGATYLRTLGLRPSVGRDFDRAIDAHAPAPMEAIIGTSLWERRYNGNPGVVGRTLGIDRQLYTIIGVAPRGFKGLSGQAELFLPITTSPVDQLSEAQSHWFNVVARRKPSVSVAQVNAEMIDFGKRMSEVYPDRFVGNAAWSARSIPLDDARVAPLVKRSLLILFGAVGLVLLIACVNVANLQLGRASGRRREIAVRMAIGAGRGRLLRLLITESLLLALCGGTVALVVAWIGTHALSTVSPALTHSPRESTIGAVDLTAIRLDWVALAFTFGVALSIGVLFGLAPALRATRSTLSNALKEGDVERSTGVALAFSGRRFLVVVEVALALILLAGSGLMIRSLTKMLAIDTGFDASHVLTLRLTVPEGGMARDSLPGFYTQLVERLRAVPGVTNASLGSCPPLSGGCNRTLVTFPGQPEPDFAHRPMTGVFWTTPDYFATLRIPLKRGRMITDADRFGGVKVLLINETGARTLWPNENPVGKRVKIGQGGFDRGDGAEIVGVVGDTRQFVDSAARTEMYLSFAQSPRSGVLILVRSTRDVASLGPEVRRAIHDLAPSFPVYDMRTMNERAARATAQTRFSATLLGLFALTALSLAAIGIYGVMSLAVAARTREIGIRIALGADGRRVQRLVVSEGIALVSIGAVLGIGGALVCTRVLQTLLYDLTPTDPATYTGTVALLAVTAMVASWIPARRAAHVDPVVALRAD